MTEERGGVKNVQICVKLFMDGPLRCKWSSHVRSSPGKMEGLNSSLSVTLKAQEVDHVEQLRWQERHSQVKDSIAKTDCTHQTLDCLG